VLSIGTVVYLGSLPLGWHSYREYQRKDADHAAAQAAAVDAPETPPLQPDEHHDRPARLN
jgi:CDP-diacylglycerol--serine O-phosphatidyltransferase